MTRLSIANRNRVVAIYYQHNLETVIGKFEALRHLAIFNSNQRFMKVPWNISESMKVHEASKKVVMIVRSSIFDFQNSF